MTIEVDFGSFLRIPPFPGAHASQLSFSRANTMPNEVKDRIRALRVGGNYWGPQPTLPQRYVLLATENYLDGARSLGGDVVFWTRNDIEHATIDPAVRVVGDECDPWHLLEGASCLIGSDDNDLLIVASLLNVPIFSMEGDRLTPVETKEISPPTGCIFQSPFTGEPISAIDAVELCGFWRRLINSNRDLAGGLGFAFWKQQHIEPLLWNGSEPFRFLRAAEVPEEGKAVAIWRSKASPEALAQLERAGAPLVEVEDGFLRSRGLGADCIPPLSITVDRKRPYFDPSEPSELECLLEEGKFDADLLERAAELRQMIVDGGIGKYEQGLEVIPRPAGDRRTILVAGQVEDDRAVTLGGCGLTSNLDLLAKVRQQAREAYILFKPHPDVMAGHRRGWMPDEACLRYADEIVGRASIGSLIAMVDEVHVNSSLAGFEALLRGKLVVTYGVPFYAGWGLTVDRGPVPVRRTARRSLDELVAATLLIYPRYLDPLSGLPCPAEVVVARLGQENEEDGSLLVGVRRLQGKLMRRLRSLVQ